MKKILSAGFLAVVGLAMTGCDDFINEYRYPETLIENSPEYWSNSDNCDLQVNRFYQYFYGYGNGNTLGNFYFNTLTDDQCGNGFTDWKFTNVPNSSSTYNNAYTVIRGCNLIIDGVNSSTLSESQKANYIAIARMMRGYYWCDKNRVRLEIIK